MIIEQETLTALLAHALSFCEMPVNMYHSARFNNPEDFAILATAASPTITFILRLHITT
jgi:hypothetical protein